MSFVLRRSIPSIGGLLGLLLVVGFAAVVFLGAPLWFPVAFAVALVLVQYAVNPWIVQWLVPATVIDHDGQRYLTDHPVGEIVVRRCRDAGIPLVRLGIVDDGTPNAFTFGRTPRDARMWLTRGLLERLDADELDAVVAHEVGHVKHWDFAVMTVAAVVPMVLFLVYLTLRGSEKEAKAIAVGAYIAYVVSQFVVLSLSRAREYAADQFSCASTGHGDALASALVKVAYGMGQARAEERERAAALVASGPDGRKAARRDEAKRSRARSLGAMGIFEPSQAEAMAAAFAGGIDPERAVAAMRWDVVNPWGATLEKLSSHPLVARRIDALEESGLPGAPRTWSVLRASAAAVDPGVRASLRAAWVRELAVALAPWVVLLAVLLGALTGSLTAIGLALAVAGGLFFVKQHVRYPGGRFEPVDEVAGLLSRLDAGPVAGIPVEVRGRLIGRGMPGYVLSPDLVVQDTSGFVPLLYRQPLPFWASLFGLLRVPDWLGREVVARGWYRRLPGPAVELQSVWAADGSGPRARTWEWAARYGAAVVLFLVGFGVVLAGLAR